MAERRDHAAIKLFGQTIRITEEGESPAAARNHDRVDKEKIVSKPGRSGREEETYAEEEETEEEQSELTGESITNNGSGNNLLKKPEKIVPCPRCSSKDTKFCYYNNYSLNQPRHFCTNCLRYWTAGGAMRKLPVGAGSRKNKKASFTAANQNFFYPPKPNGTVLRISTEFHKEVNFTAQIP